MPVPLENAFESQFAGRYLSEMVTNPNISVGRWSYYSGWHHGHGFDDCARYLQAEPGAPDRLVIGAFCSIGTGAVFVMGGNQGHRADWISTYPFHWDDDPEFGHAPDGFLPAGDTVIGDDVWIGAEAMIMPGVTVGPGAVIGARAVVTRDVAPYAVVSGVPAKEVRRRFAEEDVARLLEMRWWDWPVERIREALPLLCSGDVAGLHAHWRGWAPTAG